MINCKQILLFCYCLFSFKLFCMSECENRLREYFKYHNDWVIANAILTAIPPISIFSVWNIPYNKRLAQKFQRAYRIVRQSWMKKTNRKIAPQLTYLIDDLKFHNPNIKKRYIKTVIKDWSLNNQGLCEEKRKNIEYINFLSYKNIRIMTMDKVIKKYKIHKPHFEDDEETTASLSLIDEFK